MTLLFNCKSVSKSYGTRKLFQDLFLSIFSQDRIGLIGPNGSGKSTFLKIIAGLEQADRGTLSPRKGLRIGYVPQSCDFLDQSAEMVLIEAIKEDIPDYEKKRLAETWLSKLGFTQKGPSAAFLSGGWKKRLAIAVALINSPDLLLLDEPTNHLDLEGILWLEKFLNRESLTYLLISHDRYFLQNCTQRVIEIDPIYPQGIFAIDGPYPFFLEKKEEFLQGQLQQERSLASKARKETDWLRQGAKARTTKSQARIDEAHEILEKHAELQSRNRSKRTDIDFVTTQRETRKLLVANNLGKSIGGRLLFQHLHFTLSPGSRLGLMGPNGSGKTTLLKLLAKEILPDQGTLKTADDLKIIYFDQHRAKLPLTTTLREALSPRGDYVEFRGQSIHVNGWCKRFLFSPDLLDLKIGNLSGGERARIAIAHLMLQPADLLLLDEPTNDLDIPTLETLEESLLEFPGAVVLIAHDRYMLSRVCNSLVSLEDGKEPRLYADYHQWEKAQSLKIDLTKEVKKEAPLPPKTKGTSSEKKEYQTIEGKIATLEKKLQEQNLLLQKEEIIQDAQRLSEVCQTISLLEVEIERLFLRWEELDQKFK